MVAARSIHLAVPLFSTRIQRLLLALLVVWLFGTFDLLVTHAQAKQTDFHELNPVAGAIVGQPLYVLAAYKYGLLGGASLIFLMLRTYRSSELGAWFLAASHALLIAYWGLYFSFLI